MLQMQRESLDLSWRGEEISQTAGQLMTAGVE